MTDFAKSPKRKDAPREESPDPYPVERFYNYPKEIPNFSMGQKREVKQDEKPGPCDYEPSLQMTKTRVQGGKFSPVKDSRAAPKKSRPQTGNKK